jgi:type VI secretion system secreted protein VgrG
MPIRIPTPRPPWWSTRTLTVKSPAIPEHLGEPVLQALRLEGDEGVNSLFQYQLTLRTLADICATEHGTAGWDLNSFIDQPLSCRIQIDNSSVDYFKYPGHATSGLGNGTGPAVREINGIVTAAEFLGDDGEQAQYRLTLRPSLFKGTLSANCRIFQNMTAGEILREVAGRHQSDLECKLTRLLPNRDYQTQYNETDFAFFERLCQEWGINYYFVHEEGRHTLQLTDCMTFEVTSSAPYQCVQYHAPGWKADPEYLHSVVLGHQLAMHGYECHDYDYTCPAVSLEARSVNQRIERKASGVFHTWHGGPAATHYAQPQAGGQRLMNRQVLQHGVVETIEQGNLLARRRLEAFNSAGRRLHASGNLRGMVPGRLFTLAGHPRKQANASYLVIESHFLLEEVPQESRRATGPSQQWRVHVELTGHPSEDELRPEPTRSKPYTHGPQTAVVTGPEGYPVWTDGYGRIQVRFHWDRSKPGPADLPSSCWIRVASS